MTGEVDYTTKDKRLAGLGFPVFADGSLGFDQGKIVCDCLGIPFSAIADIRTERIRKALEKVSG